MAEKKFSYKNYVQENSLPIILQVLGLLVLIFNLWIASRLAPIVQDLAVIAQEVKANVMVDERDHKTFVTKDTFNEVVSRLDHISNRVDAIYGKLIK